MTDFSPVLYLVHFYTRITDVLTIKSMHHRSHRVFFEIHAMYVFGFCEEKSMTLETLHYYFSIILNQNPTNQIDFHLSAKIVYVQLWFLANVWLVCSKYEIPRFEISKHLFLFLFRIKMYRSSIPIDLEDSDRAFSHVYFIIVLYILISVNQKSKIFVIKQLFL